jgi:oxygen-independent coproporphyrinogen-3 oxidase
LKHPDGYCKAVETNKPIPFESEILAAETRKIERIMLGLRLNEGIPLGITEQKKIAVLENRGWVTSDNTRLKLTSEGRHFCSEVALELI